MIENSFQISVLASGSSGNSLYIETSQQKILVDAGLSGKKIDELFKEIDRAPCDLDKILITHEHSDHTKGVGILARKYELDIYANEKTWHAIDGKLGMIDKNQKHIFEMGKVKTFGDLDVESFGVSHDARSSQFYSFHKQNKTFVVLTDTGYVSENLRNIIKGADAYLIESNHDVGMLLLGSYSWNLKQRILSDVGHISNEDAANVMAEIIGENTRRVYLGHLSRENNLVELAHLTMKNKLIEEEVAVHDDFKICDTSPEHATKLFCV